MILADDNFATIIKAVANGRTVFENIKNAIMYLLSGNLSAIITVLFASIGGFPVPFIAVQLLFINLVTDSLPALAIGMEPGAPDILDRKPRDPKVGILDKSLITKVTLQGIIISVGVIAAFMIGRQTSAAVACTMAFSTFDFLLVCFMVSTAVHSTAFSRLALRTTGTAWLPLQLVHYY